MCARQWGVMRDSVLLRNSIQRIIIVETKIAGVDDVVGTSLLREIVEGPEVACASRKLALCFLRGR